MSKETSAEGPEPVARLDSRRFSQNFLARVEQPAGFEILLDHLPDVYFFAKDGHGRFVRCNQAFLGWVRRTREDEVIGAKDADLFPASLAENYMRDDRLVLRTGQAILDRIELNRNPDGSLDWLSTTKLPLLDRTGAVIGVCGVTRDLKRASATSARFLSWAPVLEAMLCDYAEPLAAADLAQKVRLSVSQFNRQFKKNFRTTPRSYLTDVRINAACHLLVSTDLPISEIARQTGFYDQSHLSNQFTRHRGVSPSQYRAKYAAEAAETPNGELSAGRGDARISSKVSDVRIGKP